VPAANPTRLDLVRAVEDERKQAAVRSLDMSLNELRDMHKSGELVIQPDYQRLFRWDEVKQSQFIESLILELPVPPIYAVELEEGKWELIDGLQRLSTYLHFCGELAAPYRDPEIKIGDFLQLEKCDIVHSLDGLTYNDLPTQLQYRVKRAKLRVEIVRKETNQKYRYYMFKRLNTGGEVLSEQEIRNCSIRLLGDRFNEFITALAKDGNLQICIEDLTDVVRQKMGEPELVLRYFAFKNNFDEFHHDISPFLTDFMERVSDPNSDRPIPFEYRLEEAAFRKTFRVLANTLGADTCRRHLGSKYGGGFSAHHFEAFSLGVSRVLGSIPDDLTTVITVIREALTTIKQDSAFKQMTTGGGKNSRGKYEEKISFVVKALSKVL
jgi:hypothetical protein